MSCPVRALRAPAMLALLKSWSTPLVQDCTGMTELQAYKLQKTATYEFELRGPVLSYYTDDGHRKKMGAIHFEDRENTEVMPSKVSSHAHPPRLRVQCLTGAVLGARTTRRCSKCCR